MDDHLKILALTNATASHKWRLSPIAERINESTEHEMFVADYTQWKNDTYGANICVFEMITGPEMVDLAHSMGAKVIYEADDAVIDTYGKERKNLHQLDEKDRGRAIETIAKCDAITTTNKRLAENYRRFTDKPIYVLPNYLDLDWYKSAYTRPERNTDEVRIGWFGSQGHFEDLRMILPAINKVLAKYPNTRLVYCGYGGISDGSISTSIVYGEDVFAEIPRDRREFYLPVNEDLWPHKHKTLDIDIGLCPLIDDEFNKCKTQIKWMEYAMNDVPAVCSRVLYGEHPEGDGSVVTHGVDGFLCDTIDDWEKYISMLVEDTQLRKQIARAAKEKVLKDWDMENNWTRWQEAYEEVLSS